MTTPFTARQGQILAFIHGFIVKFGVAPSFDEIAAHFGVTSPSVNGMIKTLERRGLLGRVPGVARSLRVLVPAAELPSSDFGKDASRATSPRRAASEVPPVSVVDAATATAIAVLDTVMPQLASAAAASPGEDVVREAAGAVRTTLVRLGLDEATAMEAARLVAAEAARWSSDGRGAVLGGRQWVRRSRRPW